MSYIRTIYLDYYISSGSGSKLYTLRQNIIKVYQDAQYPRDIHRATLCADLKKAIEKATVYCKQDTVNTLNLSNLDTLTLKERKSPTTINWEIFQSGKYIGQHYASVCESDPKYVTYLIEKYSDSQSYSKTLELCKSHPSILKIESDRLKRIENEEIRKQELEKKKKETIERSGHFHKDGEKVELLLAIVSKGSFSTVYGLSNVITLKDVEGNIYTYIGSSGELCKPYSNQKSTDGSYNYVGHVDSNNELCKISNDQFYRVKATIKHSSYKNVNQTLLVRPRVIVNQIGIIDQETGKILFTVSEKDHNKNYDKFSEKCAELIKVYPRIAQVYISNNTYWIA